MAKTTKKAPVAAPKKRTQKKTVVELNAINLSNLSQFDAVKAKARIDVGEFKVQASPPDFRKEQLTDQKIKRFHGSKLLLSWLSPGFIRNAKDHFGYLFSGKRIKDSVLDYSTNVDRVRRLGAIIGAKESAGIADSPIPAGYTYLGQFIDHDITLDVNSDISQRQDATEIPNMRSPSLDLDAIYGRGPGLDMFLYDSSPTLGRAAGIKLLLGSNRDQGNGGPQLSTGTFGNPSSLSNNFDVPRTSSQTAIIGDHRNDENLIVAQLHHAFLKFHNAVVDKLVADGSAGDLFTEAKKIVTHHYQWVVVNDFLKRIADPAIVERALTRPLRFFKGNKMFMPVEFSVAAYRFGHSMIRNSYFVNAPLTGQLPAKSATLNEIFAFVRRPMLPVLSNWVIDFNLYFPARPVPTAFGTQFNNARKIDTRLAPDLSNLPEAGDAFMKFLAQRNLVRGLALGLPSGQAVATEMGITPLSEEKLKRNNSVEENTILEENGKLLLKKTPLWYYVLKEAEIEASGDRLGPVGSTIVAETFVKMLQLDPNSYVKVSGFRPSLPRFNGAPAGDFNMTDLLNFAGVLTLR